MEIEADVDPGTQQALLRAVHRHTGISMNEKKWTMLQGRLRPRLRTLSLRCYRDYLALLENAPDEVRNFVNLVTTNETAFFRTPRVWDYFAQHYLPRWYAANPGRSLRLWSAAASSGEEPYSAAMICEEFRARHPGFQYQIHATDISSQVLASAAAGRYGGRSIDGLRQQRPAMLAKYFRADAAGFTVVPELRAHITFAEHNLYQHMARREAFDLVMLRNVLIYFETADQERVLENVRRTLAPHGVLIVGESESLARLSTGYRFEQPLIYRNQGAPNGAVA
ncbi:protein-glutamate O-methyltransferase CheR [Pandoraea nosoerga]|uniref:protein-glutamate O-methyltransferase n=1 Tax=Pandoraea nosoerga TaxID=2508296 RepID=A0A5E4VT25_9BURK|nr:MULTISPECIES: protein-glutamate O-methyltransferase CheR [Pandoraea]MBN4667960.1 protein-glutamate O-methyltransferase CheR [Pandoraea nosoerga]MBN4677894.1 protein-glutamate O-methyltransferase CheR [Pandoraea nosoerga]MBN4683049.1 protein-glutamate O-methyltransferase CheR [Pandoraea nosoerga]MBN4747022.1 protein-glutamate O-methyltransferase CheR [Pandoraea nosoerga]VVE15508.1 chemotaxis protein [Pandoraea nosoerga]